MVKTRLVRTYLRSTLISVFLLVALVSLRANFNNLKTFFGFAALIPADLKVDADFTLGAMSQPWRSISQGGEDHQYRFLPVAEKLKALQPEYIRLDHLYDFYEPVSRGSNSHLNYNWTKLDAVLSDITAAGAIPFLSLSYMPSALNSNDLTGKPTSYDEWRQVVKATIEHVSGRENLNLSQVYYEVWNEPDLFGKWNTYGDKNYLTLYEYAAKAASQAANVNEFKIGGPATTHQYDNWINRLLEHVTKNKLRLDFYSWHVYSNNPTEYFDSLQQYFRSLTDYPELRKIEPVISEWGHNSQVDNGYDTALSAAHAVSVLSQLIPTIRHAFVFEFQDGKDPTGQEYWGRWGLLTHQDFGSREKPRYQALQLLNQLGKIRLNVEGQGSLVKAIATKNSDNSIQLIITNYDPNSRNVETVPVTINHLTASQYRLTTQYLGRLATSTLITPAGGTFSTSIPLAPNAVALLNLTPQ